MAINTYIGSSPLHTIVKRSESFNKSRCICFTGSPRKHPYDPGKLLLLTSPMSSHTHFLEFLLSDIQAIDETTSLASESGESANMVNLWVRKGSFGIRYEPFEVAEPLRFLNDTEIIHYTSQQVESDTAD